MSSIVNNVMKKKEDLETNFLHLIWSIWSCYLSSEIMDWQKTLEENFILAGSATA